MMTLARKIFLSAAVPALLFFPALAGAAPGAADLAGAWVGGGSPAAMLQFFDDGAVAAVDAVIPAGRSAERAARMWARYDVEGTGSVAWHSFKINGNTLEISGGGGVFTFEIENSGSRPTRLKPSGGGQGSAYTRVLSREEMDAANKFRNAVNGNPFPGAPPVTAEYLTGQWLGQMRADGTRALLRVKADGRWRVYSARPPEEEDTLEGYPKGWGVDEKNFAEGRMKFLPDGEVRFRRIGSDRLGYDDGYETPRAISGDMMEMFQVVTDGGYSDEKHGKATGFYLYKKISGE